MPKPAAEIKPAAIRIALWKKLLLLAVVALFGRTLYEYFSGAIEGSGAWLWPMLFIPLLLYLMGIIYGDVPARYYSLKTLKPFPVPFARQFDRCVLALIVLFMGIFLNILLLATSLILSGPSSWQFIFYALYSVLMLIELPNSMRIFRFIQHVNTMQYVNEIRPDTFKPALSYYRRTEENLSGEKRQKLLKEVYDLLVEEAKTLCAPASPLKEEQQIALNLAVRSGEAIRRIHLATREHEPDRLKANLMLLDALRENAGLQLPPEIQSLYDAPKGDDPAKREAKDGSTP